MLKIGFRRYILSLILLRRAILTIYKINTEGVLNQEVGMTSPTIVSDLQEDNISDYSVSGFKVEPLFKGVPPKTLLDPKFWKQFIED